jgi:tetraacyldisaccharide 4'-kinase
LKRWLEALAARHWWRPRPSGLCVLLWPLSQLYRALFLLHAKSAKATLTVPVPVWVVGNLVVGGAGKTPTVIALVQALQQAGRRPGVISRGYGRSGSAPMAATQQTTAAQAGDEPLLIQRRCQVPVWVGRHRVATARALCTAHPEVDLIVSDDGLQHHALPRDRELIVFDERGAGNGWLLPAGPLRAPLPTRLEARQTLLYTAGVASTALPGHQAQRRLGPAWPLVAWQAGDSRQALPLHQLRGRRLLAVAGLAAPQKFFGMLTDAGLSIEPLPLPDHHPYTTLPWPPGTAEVITTEKDAIKLAPRETGGTAVWVVPLDLTLPPELITALLTTAAPPHEP